MIRNAFQVCYRTSSQIPRASLLQVTRALSGEVSSGGGSFSKRGKAEEERYFKSLSQEQLKKFSEAVHKKELQKLVEILPEDHNLSADTLHDILVWKHQEFM